MRRLLILGLSLGLWCAMVTPAIAGTSDDADGDLLPDAWESAHGLNPADPADADADPDGDRLVNRDEFWAGTDPRVFTAESALSDRQVLNLFAGKAFLYFWEQSRPPYYFTADNADYNDRNKFSNDFNSIATTGFGLVSYVVADERGWVDHQEAYERIRTLLARAVALQDPALTGGNRHGYLFHFVNNQGFGADGVEISTIDHALFVAGVLVAAEYYRGTDVEQLARQLYLNTDWRWLYNGNFLWQGWFADPNHQPQNAQWDGGSVFDEWNRYSELMVLMFLAMGHPDPAHAIPASAWDHLTFGQGRMFPWEYAHLVPGNPPPNTQPERFGFVPNLPTTLDAPGFQNSATELHYIHAGSLHNHQYSHLFADFRARKDKYQTDFFANSIAATMVNRQYCLNLNLNAYGGDPFSSDPALSQPYETYGPDSWGLMAGLSSVGYEVLQPIIMAWDSFSPANISAASDSGTVVLSTALGSTPFTPRQTVDFTRNMLRRFQANEPGYDALVGRYGFRNAFNLGRTNTGQLGHFPAQVIGLDMGPVIGSAENFLSGLVWKFAMRNEFLQRGMQAAGFPTGPVEPFILNFDNGQDPNAFGGASVAFGSGTIAYVNIGDPFPDANYGPQYWAQKISAQDNNDSGGFILLNNHSVSQWDRLSFWIRGERGGEQYSIGLKDSIRDRLGNALQPTEVKLPITSYHPDGVITTEWRGVQIPLRDFAERGVRLTALDNLSFTCTGPGGGTIEVDDIAFLGDEFTPQAPQGLHVSTDGPSVTLNWRENQEPDVVGYRVYRSTDYGATFQLLTPTLVVATTWTDTNVVQGALYYYALTAVDNAQPANESPRSATMAVPLIILTLSDAPDPFSPNADGRKDTTTISTTLNHAANWTLDIKNSSNVIKRTYTGSGSSVARVWDGKATDGSVVGNGVFTYVLTATDAGNSTVVSLGTVTVDKKAPSLSNLKDAPDPFAPRSGQTTTMSFTLSEQAVVTLQIFNSSNVLVRTLLNNVVKSSGAHSVVWNGKNDGGAYVAAGKYTYKVWIEDPAGNRASPYPATGTVTVK